MALTNEMIKNTLARIRRIVEHENGELDIKACIERVQKESGKDELIDLVLGGMSKSASGLWVPSNMDNPIFSFNFPMSYAQLVDYEAPSSALPPESEFEVNLTEALVGWRAWFVKGRHIHSMNKPIPWDPDVPFIAFCEDHEDAPYYYCTCGVYACDRIEEVPAVGGGPVVLGEVYGWGRYVRGTEGWRVQYSYPKRFILKHGQEELVDVLKRYHVPISIEQPIEVYSPEEDGYECRGNQAYGDSGAVTGSDTAEDNSSGDQDDEED